jgi:hypothetical protein
MDSAAVGFVQAGGVLAFAGIVYLMLRGHLGKVEGLIRESNEVQMRLAVALERLAGQVVELRDDVTPRPGKLGVGEYSIVRPKRKEGE